MFMQKQGYVYILHSETKLDTNINLNEVTRSAYTGMHIHATDSIISSRGILDFQNQLMQLTSL